MKILFLLIVIGILLCIPKNFAQMPPNPKLLDKIKSGEKVAPYAFSNLNLLRNKGIDAPWTAPELQRNQIQNAGVFQRKFGPLHSPSGNWKALVILVSFTDNPYQVNTSYFDNLLFTQTSGTLWDYYKKISYNNLDIVTVDFPSEIGWENAPHTYSYYVNGQNGLGDYPQNTQKMVEDVVTLIDTVVNFSQYDNDGDGYVDALFVVHTGPGAEFTGSDDDIWSHAWVTSYEMNVDGVKIWHYSTEPEYWQNPGDMTIGVYAHELGHAAFGLPDLYDTDYSSSGLGNWSLMASGSWNGPSQLGSSPAMPDAFCRIQMGFASPISLNSNVTGQSIEDVEDNPTIFRLWTNGTIGSEYFLVENRQLTSFDQSLPNGGLLIYHVDESVTSDNMNEWYPDHTSSGHYLVALEQADGLYDLEKGNNKGDAGDCYPGSTNHQNFSNSTNPDSKDYNFSATGVIVDNISLSSLTMSADLQVVLGVDIALVIDRSGSMGSSNYLEPAKSAAKTFVGLMQIGDKIAAVSFDQAAYINFPLTTIISDATKIAAQNAINSITVGGNTSIGGGIQVGQNQLNNGNTQVTQGMVLLSDGQENTAPWVSDILPTIPVNTDIYTIALGPNSDQTLLNNIATQTGGFYSFAPDAGGLQVIYNSIRAKVSGQQVIANFTGVIAPSQTITHTAPVDGSVTNATFAVTWPGSDLNLELIDPNGRIINPDTALVDPNIEFSTGSTYEYYTVNSPVAGNWTLKIIAISVPSGGEDYNASVVGTAALKMDINFSKDEYYHSEPILISANINEVGYPIINATVTADVITPALASVMSFRKSRNSSRDETLMDQKSATILHKVIENDKTKYYDENGQLFYSNSTITLFDDGLHNDSLANDGIYASYFLNTAIEGSYIFTVNATGVSPISGNFSREATKSTVVGSPINPDFEANFVVFDSCSASQNLVFGTAFDATDCIDVTYDCYAPPPPPPSVLTAWFETCNENLLCDFRKTNIDSEIIWNVKFQPVAGCPVSFSWNPSELPPYGYFYLVDLLNGEINMRTQSSYTISSSALTFLSIKYQRPPSFQISVNISNGWNMVSVPGMNPDGMGVSNWWSGHTGTVYKFVPGSGYIGTIATTPGEGYWMKNNGAQTYNTGDEWPVGGLEFVNHDPINVASGWNIFGGYEDIVNAAALTTTPPGQIVSIYKFVPGTGYQPAAQIVPGYGYWVKVASACQINIPNFMAKSNPVETEYFKDDWGRITVTDATGNSYTLYAVKGEVDLNQYELPPLPPAGLFDVRFGSGRVAENINSSAQSIEMR